MADRQAHQVAPPARAVQEARSPGLGPCGQTPTLPEYESQNRRQVAYHHGPAIKRCYQKGQGGLGVRLALSVLRKMTVGIKKSALELKRDLNAIAANLESTAGEISRLAERVKDVDVVAVLHLMNQQYKDADRLRAYVDEIKAGRITRSKAD